MVQFCDAIIMLELNWHVKMLHPDIQKSEGWTPFEIQTCCGRARVWASKKLARIACAVATWSDARTCLRDLGNFIRLSMVCRHWCSALDRNRKEYARIGREQNGQTQGKFPGMLWERHPPKGAMSPDAFWHEMSLPIFESQHQKEEEKDTDLLDDEK